MPFVGLHSHYAIFKPAWDLVKCVSLRESQLLTCLVSETRDCFAPIQAGNGDLLFKALGKLPTFGHARAVDVDPALSPNMFLEESV